VIDFVAATVLNLRTKLDRTRLPNSNYPMMPSEYKPEDLLVPRIGGRPEPSVHW
jgi:hypothetical protein